MRPFLFLSLIAMSTCLLSGPAYGQDNSPGPAKPPDLGGVWAQQVVTTAVSDVPIVGRVVTRSVSIQRVKIRQHGLKLRLETRVCEVQLYNTVDSVETHIPSGFTNAMGLIERPAKLAATGDQFSLVIPRRTKVLGVQLRVPDSEYLPTEPGDPRVRDDDHDGHPGVTVEVSGLIDGQLYLVHRGWDRLEGRVADADEVTGQVQWGQQEVVLDSTSIFLGQPPDSHPHANAERHYFQMKRINDDVQCSDLKAKAATLFTTRYPAD